MTATDANQSEDVHRLRMLVIFADPRRDMLDVRVRWEDDLMQQAVGGSVQMCAFTAEDEQLTLLVNEDGQRLGLRHNAAASTLLSNLPWNAGQRVLGNVVVARTDPDTGDYVDLTDGDIAIIGAILTRRRTRVSRPFLPKRELAAVLGMAAGVVTGITAPGVVGSRSAERPQIGTDPRTLVMGRITVDLADSSGRPLGDLLVEMMLFEGLDLSRVGGDGRRWAGFNGEGSHFSGPFHADVLVKEGIDIEEDLWVNWDRGPGVSMRAQLRDAATEVYADVTLTPRGRASAVMLKDDLACAAMALIDLALLVRFGDILPDPDPGAGA